VWLLEQLEKDDGIRINCGGSVYREQDGATWGKDRFFHSGAWQTPHAVDMARTEDDSLYRASRNFQQGRRHGYSIPLPRGRYRIVLHFGEIFFVAPGCRGYDVLLEGQTVEPDYDPVGKGAFTADSLAFTRSVVDGTLDIDFVRKRNNPIISAIEIHTLKTDQ
jgi:hypothetical protein